MYGLIAFTTSFALGAPKRLDTPHDAKPLMLVEKNNALAREVRKRLEFLYQLRERKLLVLFSNSLTGLHERFIVIVCNVRQS